MQIAAMKYLAIAVVVAVLLCAVQALPNYRSFESHPRRTWPANAQFDIRDFPDKEEAISDICKLLHEHVCEPPVCEGGKYIIPC